MLRNCWGKDKTFGYIVKNEYRNLQKTISVTNIQFWIFCINQIYISTKCQGEVMMTSDCGLRNEFDNSR